MKYPLSIKQIIHEVGEIIRSGFMAVGFLTTLKYVENQYPVVHQCILALAAVILVARMIHIFVTNFREGLRE